MKAMPGYAIAARLVMETRVDDWRLFARATIHEMPHQPYDTHSPEFWAAVEPLKSDAFLMKRFENHDLNRGYKDWSGYVGESCTDAMERAGYLGRIRSGAAVERTVRPGRRRRDARSGPSASRRAGFCRTVRDATKALGVEISGVLAGDHF